MKYFLLMICFFPFVYSDELLPRFWTSTGFCPIGSNITEILLSEDVATNLDIIGSLPNNALEKVRVHWSLDLIKDTGFKCLDEFFDRLMEANLYPVIEFMSHRNLKWKEIVMEILHRYIGRFGREVEKWGFETWNEPDLKVYNVLNFSDADYFKYLHDIHEVFTTATTRLELTGPSGLFRNEKSHPFCWKSLELCNKNHCPFNIISFHRKGQGSAWDIVTEGISLQKEILTKYPNLKHFKFANTEADPIVTWSMARDFQADVRYAVTLVETVILHWGAMLNGSLKNLVQISHDNAFLSFYPHQFTQRTLLARFQMNNTDPAHTQFFLKPVYSALGLLSYLGKSAKTPQIIESVMLLESNDEDKFTSYIVSYSDQRLTAFERTLVIDAPRYLVVEGLINKITDPWEIWKQNGSLDYPDAHLRKLIRKAQSSKVLVAPVRINSTFHLRLAFTGPSVYLIRLCEGIFDVKVEGIRFRPVNDKEVLIFWRQHGNGKCIYSYDIFFLSNRWRKVSRYVPWQHFHFQPKDGRVRGYYKVRATSVHGKKSQFSGIKCLEF